MQTENSKMTIAFGIQWWYTSLLDRKLGSGTPDEMKV